MSKQTMFDHRWLSVGSSQLKAWVVGFEQPIHRKGFRGTPGGTRTPNLLIRSQTQELWRPERTKVLGRQSAIHQGLPAIHTKGWPRSSIGLEWHSEIPGCPTKNAFENKVIETYVWSSIDFVGEWSIALQRISAMSASAASVSSSNLTTPDAPWKEAYWSRSS
jgi:hypothetical protein